MKETGHQKPLFWIGRSYEDLLDCPDEVRQTFGFALGLAQTGGKYVDAKPLSGFGGAGVLEVVEDYRSDTFRCVYAVKFAGAVYVLHAFQKKSKAGIKTPKQDIELVRERLKRAEEHYRQWVEKQRKQTSMKTHETVRQGGKNIFEDLKLPDAEELNVKAQIAYRICELIQKRKLTQQEAAIILGTDQPRVSALLRGRLEGFSSDRLFRFLNALDQEIEIVIRQTRKRSQPAGIRVLIPA